MYRVVPPKSWSAFIQREGDFTYIITQRRFQRNKWSSLLESLNSAGQRSLTSSFTEQVIYLRAGLIIIFQAYVRPAEPVTLRRPASLGQSARRGSPTVSNPRESERLGCTTAAPCEAKERRGWTAKGR